MLGRSAALLVALRYDWDEVGHLSRARRYDYAAGPVPAFDAGETPTWDLSYAYAGDTRVRTSASSGGDAPVYTVDIFDTHRLENAFFDPDSGYGVEHGNDDSVFLAGGLARAFDDRDAPLPRGANTSVHVFINVGDALGSSSFVIDKDTGELVEKTTYQAYGSVESDTRPSRWHSPRESLKFTGKEEDLQVGVSYFGARYFNSRIARWMSPDPLAVHGLSSDPNPYAYVRGAVFDAVDPFGLADTAEVHDVTVNGEPRPSAIDLLNDHAAALAAVARAVGQELWASTGVGNLVSAAAARSDKKSRATQATTARGVVAGAWNTIPGMNGSLSVPSLLIDRFPMAPENSVGYRAGSTAVQIAAVVVPAAAEAAAARGLGVGAPRAGAGGGGAAEGAAGGGRYVFRGISEADQAALSAGEGLSPRGAGGSIGEQVAGRATKYISASKDVGKAGRYGDLGVIAIDVERAVAGGAGFVDHSNVLQGIRREALPGYSRDLANATRDLEVLFKGGIPRDAITVVK